MKNVNLSDFDALLEVADLMHDFYFTKEDVLYNQENNTFKIKAKEYEWKGKLLKGKTSKVKGECVLSLSNIKSCDISEKDSLGYQTVGEDCFNLIKVKNDNSIIIKSSFHEIRLSMSKLDGRFEYQALVGENSRE